MNIRILRTLFRKIAKSIRCINNPFTSYFLIWNLISEQRKIDTHYRTNIWQNRSFLFVQFKWLRVQLMVGIFFIAQKVS